MSSNLDRLLELLGGKDPVPNKNTIAMGKLVRQAREEAAMSQAKLASNIFRRRATISDIENGKSDLTVSTLALIAAALDKPITYFLPWFIYDNLTPEDLKPAEEEILIQFRRIWLGELKHLAIRQVKQIAEMDTKRFRKAQQDAVEGFSNEPLSDDQ